MNKTAIKIDKVRVSRAGHTFHERWAARRALQLVFPKDDLFAITVEGLSPYERLKFRPGAEEIADLVLYYGSGDTFATCTAQQILQFKYKKAAEPITSSYLKKTIKKFAVTLRDFKASVSDEDIEEKLSFGFVTNAEFSDDLWSAIACLKSGGTPQMTGAKRQFHYLKTWCLEEKTEADDLFPLIEFRASTSDLPAQNRALRRTVSDWSAGSTGQAAKRLFTLVELVREKSEIEGQGKNSIRREDVLDALECDEDQLFPADTRFVDVGEVVERIVLQNVKSEIEANNLPVFLYADGGVGKTVFIQSLAAYLTDTFETVIFDCFGGGAYRSEAQARHLPRVGLLQIINELSTRGLCEPLFPTDSDQYGLVEIARKRLKQASETVKNQSAMQGVLLIIDAADNAQLEANVRNETAFPRLLLASLSVEPIDGVKLLLTARPHRMDKVIGTSQTKRIELKPFTEDETCHFLKTRRENITDVEFSTVLARSLGNARVLEYLVESWDMNVSGNAPQTEISVEELIAQKCEKIFRDLHTVGWSEIEVREFFAALSLLPPPIPLTELAEALEWSDAQVNSAASDLAPMLELVKHGAIFRDEPTETYIKDHYASEVTAQQSIAKRLQARQKESIYAAEALPHFLLVIGDSNRAYQLANSDEFPAAIETDYGRRKLRLVRLHAAFSLATREKDLNRILRLAMQLSQVSSANSRGDQYIRRSPALATILGDLDASRRLFNDRSGWRGARDARLVVAYCFSDELDEARIHQNRAIGWINWYLQSDDEDGRFDRSGPEVSDIAAVMFLSVLQNDFSSFNRNIQLWHFNFASSVIKELITLCVQHEVSKGSEVLQGLFKFAASKECLSLVLQIVLLSDEYGLSQNQLRAVSRSASSLSQTQKKKFPESNFDYRSQPQGAVVNAAMCSIIINSKQSAKRLLMLSGHRRLSSYDYADRHGTNSVWIPVQSACLVAWSSGETLSFQHLMPEGVKTGRKTRSITTESELSTFLGSLIVKKDQKRGRKGKETERRSQFSRREQEDIVNGAACILQLVKPIESAILSKIALSNEVLVDFLVIWKSLLRPSIHWNAETGRDDIVRQVGIGLVRILLCHSETIEKKEAQELIEIIDANRFSLGDKLSFFALIAKRTNLADVAGTYANSLSNDIVRDDYIEQRGHSYQDLSGSLVLVSIEEAQEYYARGLAQLDQMGSNDSDLIYSVLHYAAEQPGGFLKPELSHRLMNLCQTIFQHEPSKFGWTLFGRAASSSIGFPAIYKLIRWHDQDVVDYSYGLLQLVCYLARAAHLDARRAAVLITICEDHGSYEWQTGEGLHDLLLNADVKDRSAIFSLVADKLDKEHSFGGWERLWKSLLSCLDAFREINEEGIRDHLQELYDAARHHRDIENARNNYAGASAGYRLQARRVEKNEKACDNAFTSIFTLCDFTSAVSLDEAIQSIQASEVLQYDGRKRFFDEIRKTCPFNKRLKFLEALCESTELEFDSALDLMVECIEEWSDSTVHVRKGVLQLINRLFAFRGSKLFDLRYSGISRQIYRLSKLCGDHKFVLQTVLETIAKEHLDLGGDEWLQIATGLSRHSDPSIALEAFEDLLSGSAAKVGDEIGEGAYCPEYAGKSDESDVVADIIWHLLGDSDAFVRWSAARSLKSMLDLGLVEDVGRLIDRFDVDECLSLRSEEHHFAYLNAQQWLLMGLARATLHHPNKLKPLKPRLVALAKRTDLHMSNRLHLIRCLKHIEGNGAMSSELTQMWNDIQMPARGIVERDSRPHSTDSRIEFGFDYEFNKHKVPELARLFGISDNEAHDLIADKVLKYLPNVRSMSDIPGFARYRGDERYETYREHIQRHAQLHAATTLAQNRPIVRHSYDWKERNPLQEFLKDSDVSFEDGAWLSDHKDRVPAQAREYLLGQRKRRQEALVSKEILLRKVGFSEEPKDCFLPLYGYWRSYDGVHVDINSALIAERGAVGQCLKLSRALDHDLWLPSFGSDGYIDRYAKENPFLPLIWEPDKYPIGVDEGDEWATRGAIARPKLGLALNKLLHLKPDRYERQWHDRKGVLTLKSEVWGEWKPDHDSHRGHYQDEGVLLWAERDWLNQVLKSYKRSIIYTIRFSKYKSSNDYDNLCGVREIYVGLKRNDNPHRFWFARKASEKVY